MWIHPQAKLINYRTNVYSLLGRKYFNGGDLNDDITVIRKKESFLRANNP
jgi:hypothetical protein